MSIFKVTYAPPVKLKIIIYPKAVEKTLFLKSLRKV